MAWLKLFVARTNQLYRHGLLPEQHGERPMFEGPLVAEWQLLNHLIKWTIGWPFPDGQGPTHQHRIRFCAVQFALRRDELEAESDSYVAKQIAERLAREEHS
jgi:hypothetical protein